MAILDSILKKNKDSKNDGGSSSGADEAKKAEQNEAVEKKAEKKRVKEEVVITPSLGGKKYMVRDDAIFVRPLFSEKTQKLSANRKYVFQVAEGADKVAIKKAFYNIYGIMPSAVHTARFEGKRVRFGRMQGQRSSWKKAVITLRKGDEISL